MKNAPSNTPFCDAVRSSEARKCDVETASFFDANERLLSVLAERWYSYRKSGAEVMYQIGEMLNASIGPPTCKSTHNGYLELALAKHFRTTTFELRQMRWMADKFGSAEKLYRACLRWRDWKGIDSLLLHLMQGGDEDSARQQAKARNLELIQRIAEVQKRVSERRLTPSAELD